MVVRERLRRRRGNTTVGHVGRVFVRPAPLTACQCPREAGAAPLYECVMPVTGREHPSTLDRVRTSFSFKNTL